MTTTYTVSQTFATLGDPLATTHHTVTAAEDAVAGLRATIADMVRDMVVEPKPAQPTRWANEVAAWHVATGLAGGGMTYGPDAGRYIAAQAVGMEAVEVEGDPQFDFQSNGDIYTSEKALVGRIDSDGEVRVDGDGDQPELEAEILDDLRAQFAGRSGGNWPDRADWPIELLRALGERGAS